jgi:thymidylate synthase (FAD)
MTQTVYNKDKVSVKLVSITKGVGELATLSPEELIVYCARVSSPENQLNLETAPKLLAYCIRMKHWSIFEQVNMGVEVVTSRALATQLLRHRSFAFQEFSQRYAQATDTITYEARRQDLKNRQNSIDDLPQETKEWFAEKQNELAELSQKYYEEALGKQIAKESARFLLPMSTATKLYVNGSVRSWITYLLVRLDKSTQMEHREIAQGCWGLFQEQFPNISAALKETYPGVFI